MSKGLDLTTSISRFRIVPAAAFLGLMNFFPFASSICLFIFSKSLSLKNISPLSSIIFGALISIFFGIFDICKTFSVTSSPTNPSPLVTAFTSVPFS